MSIISNSPNSSAVQDWLTGCLTSTSRASQSPNKGNWTVGECSKAQGCPVIGYITPRTWVDGFRRIPWRRMVVLPNLEWIYPVKLKKNSKQENVHVPWDSQHWIFALCSVRCPKCQCFGEKSIPGFMAAHVVDMTCTGWEWPPSLEVFKARLEGVPAHGRE